MKKHLAFKYKNVVADAGYESEENMFWVKVSPVYDICENVYNSIAKKCKDNQFDKVVAGNVIHLLRVCTVLQGPWI